MQKGGDLAAVYSRLVKGATELSKKIPFSRHRRLGYLTFCPTNLGTTIRASVHARFPKLNNNPERFHEIANMYNLQVRSFSISFPFFLFFFFEFESIFEMAKFHSKISNQFIFSIDDRFETF